MIWCSVFLAVAWQLPGQFQFGQAPPPPPPALRITNECPYKLIVHVRPHGAKDWQYKFTLAEGQSTDEMPVRKGEKLDIYLQQEVLTSPSVYQEFALTDFDFWKLEETSGTLLQAFQFKWVKTLYFINNEWESVARTDGIAYDLRGGIVARTIIIIVDHLINKVDPRPFPEFPPRKPKPKPQPQPQTQK